MFEDFQYTALFLELFVNVVGLILAAVVIFRARDNRLMLTWGIYSAVLMLLLINSDIDFISHYNSGGIERRLQLLSIDLLMVTFGVMTMAAIFPLLSLRPGWLTNRRKALMSIPILLSLIVVHCFYWFDGAPTPLHNTSDIFAQIHRPDVQMRVMIFVVSILTTLYFLSILFTHRWVKGLRRMSRGMYLYCGANLLMVILYFFNASTNNMFAFYTYGYALALAPIMVSIIFLYNENPLSQAIADSQIETNKDKVLTTSQVIMSPQIKHVYEQIEQYMNNVTPYTEANYSISQLASDINANEHLVIRAIRERGYSGYTEYINVLRIEHFKTLASKFPGLSIKELMFGSGFTSRSSFYRRFAQRENMSPKEYIERKL